MGLNLRNMINESIEARFSSFWLLRDKIEQKSWKINERSTASHVRYLCYMMLLFDVKTMKTCARYRHELF